MKWMKPKLESLNNASTVAGLCAAGGSNMEDRCEAGAVAYLGPCFAGGEVISVVLNCTIGNNAAMLCSTGNYPS